MSGLAIALRQKNFAKYDILLKNAFKAEGSGLRQALGIPVGTSLSGELGGLSRLIIDSLIESDGIFYHVEFQSKNDVNMPWRMLAYYHRLMEDHLKNRMYPRETHVHQIVLYVGHDALRMEPKIDQDRLQFCFEVSDIRSFDHISDNLLTSQNPQDWIVGLLCKKSMYPAAWRTVARKLHQLRHQDNWFWREIPAMFIIAGILREVPVKNLKEWEQMLEVNIKKSEIFREVYDQAHDIGAATSLREAIDDRLDVLEVRDSSISKMLDSLDLSALKLVTKRLNRVTRATEAYSAIFEVTNQPLQPGTRKQ